MPKAETPDKNGLTPKQQQLAELLGDVLDDRPLERMSEEVGVSRDTRCRWAKMPEFVAEQNRVKEITAVPVECESLRALVHIVRYARRDSDRVAAARTLLEHLRKAGSISVVTNVNQNVTAQELVERIQSAKDADSRAYYTNRITGADRQ